MNSQKLEKGLFNFTACIVSVFTLVLAFNLLSFRPTLKELIKAARQPASIPKSEMGVAAQFPAAGELEHVLPCVENGASYKFASPSQRLRIESQLCKAKSDMTESLIVNKTNGFVATVFKLNTKEFTTDLIDLKPGENLIHVSHTLENGDKVLAEMTVTFVEKIKLPTAAAAH